MDISDEQYDRLEEIADNLAKEAIQNIGLGKYQDDKSILNGFSEKDRKRASLIFPTMFAKSFYYNIY